MGGYRADPVLLDVTLYAERVAPEEIGRVAGTTIDRLYPVQVADDAAGRAARFAGARWLPELRDGAAGVAVTPRLQAHFDEIPGFDRRMAERHDRAVQATAAALAPCGVARLTP